MICINLSIHHSFGWSPRLQCLLSCRFLCIFGRFAKFSSIFLHSEGYHLSLKLTTGSWAVLALHAIQANDGLVPSQQHHQAIHCDFELKLQGPGERLSHPTMAIPPFFSYTVDNGSLVNHGREASLRWWHCLFPNFVVEYKISFLVTGRSQYLEASKQAKNCWCFGYTLYPHIMFERGLTKPHRIFRMTHIDDANVIPCCCLWQNWFSCVLASMPSPLMFELRILLKAHGVYIKKQGGKSQVPRTRVDVI